MGILLFLLFFHVSTPTHIDNLVTLTNSERATYQETPLVEDARLDKSARVKACDLYHNHYFSHTDKQGRLPWHLFIESGYIYKAAGENLAINFTSDGDLINAWMASPTHKANIINPKYTEIGIGRCGNIIAAHYASHLSLN